MKVSKVLVPIEDEFFGNLIADYIIEHKWADNTVFQVLHVFPGPPDIPLPPSYHEYREIALEVAWKLVESISRRIKNSLEKAVVEECLVEGSPKQEIISVARAWQPELIVMGSHGRKDADVELFPIGSVSAAVSVHAPCTVTIVRAPSKTKEVASAAKKEVTPLARKSSTTKAKPAQPVPASTRRG